MQSYKQLIHQTFEFPTTEFSLRDNQLAFHNLPLMQIIEQYGSPLKLSYLPKISQNIKQAREWFGQAMQKLNYHGDYIYSYCTKSSHFKFVLEEVLKMNCPLELSSAYDIEIIRALNQENKIQKQSLILCNGSKNKNYLEGIISLIKSGHHRCIPILDAPNELDYYEENLKQPYSFGLRVAIDEDPQSQFYNSRLGLAQEAIEEVCRKLDQADLNGQLTMLHFFINSGIKDTAYYWSELDRMAKLYARLKKLYPSLTYLDIGGGFPIKQNLYFEYDYPYMVNQIVQTIKSACDDLQVPTPDIITEFGSYTVGESGAVIYEVLDQKPQNDKELWYMINGSFITHLPDAWGMDQKYIMLPINHWGMPYHKANLGGITCDGLDYYKNETYTFEAYLPTIPPEQPLYIGFFHTGAYQEALGGYGGLQHCLIPAPRHLLLRLVNDQLHVEVFAEQQSADSMLKVLGF